MHTYVKQMNTLLKLYKTDGAIYCLQVGAIGCYY